MFNLLPSAPRMAHLIYADWLEENDESVTASAIRQNLTTSAPLFRIHVPHRCFIDGWCDSEGRGEGDGNGDGWSALNSRGEGSGKGNGYGIGSGAGSGSGEADGFGQGHSHSYME